MPKNLTDELALAYIIKAGVRLPESHFPPLNGNISFTFQAIQRLNSLLKT